MLSIHIYLLLKKKKKYFCHFCIVWLARMNNVVSFFFFFCFFFFWFLFSCSTFVFGSTFPVYGFYLSLSLYQIYQSLFIYTSIDINIPSPPSFSLFLLFSSLFSLISPARLIYPSFSSFFISHPSLLGTASFSYFPSLSLSLFPPYPPSSLCLFFFQSTIISVQQPLVEYWTK